MPTEDHIEVREEKMPTKRQLQIMMAEKMRRRLIRAEIRAKVRYEMSLQQTEKQTQPDEEVHGGEQELEIQRPPPAEPLARLTKAEKKAIKEKVRREFDIKTVTARETEKKKARRDSVAREAPKVESVGGQKQTSHDNSGESFITQAATCIRDFLIVVFGIALGIFFCSRFDGALEPIAKFGRFWLGVLLWLYESASVLRHLGYSNT